MNCIFSEFWEIKAPKLNGSVKNLFSRGTPNIPTVTSSMNSIKYVTATPAMRIVISRSIMAWSLHRQVGIFHSIIGR